jgi:phenylacetate-CoA ligase
VFSTLTREAGPLLRYRTGDIATLRRGPCPCGRTLVKMSQVTGRRDDMLVIRGVNIYPSEVERVLLGHTSLSPDYLLVVDERAAQSQLLALCEYAPDIPGRDGAGSDGAGSDGAHGAGPAEADLELRLREVLGVRVGVRVVPRGTLPRTEVGKAVRVVRWAGGEPPVPGLS